MEREGEVDEEKRIDGIDLSVKGDDVLIRIKACALSSVRNFFCVVKRLNETQKNAFDTARRRAIGGYHAKIYHISENG